jgi:membrane-associated phospholipid phosphatase
MSLDFIKEKKKQLIFIIIFFAVGFTIEFFYRKPLFENSVEIATSVQDKMLSSTTFFKYWAYLGVIEFFLAIIFFIFFPISFCFSFFLNMIITVHLCDFAKLVYSQGRPFLLDKKVYITCEAGYGNPSGHSFRFTSNLLAFVQMFIDLYQLNKKYSIIIYTFSAILILSINFSRIILGVHSINQVIYGDTLGFTVYFIIFHIIEPHKKDINKFYNIFLDKKFHIFNIIALIINAISFTIVSITNEKMELENYEELKKKLIEICGKHENEMLSRDAKTKILYIFAYYGMIYGMTLLTYFVKNHYYQKYEELNYYYKNTRANKFVTYGTRILFTIIGYSPLICIYTNKNIDIYIVYVLASAFPMFLFGFLLFSINYILTIILNLANVDLYMAVAPDKTKEENILDKDNNEIINNSKQFI